MTIVVAGGSHVGTVRALNEDCIAIKRWGDDRVLAVLADGMGGYKGGDVASRLCVDTILESLGPVLASGEKNDILQRLVAAAESANQAIFQARLEHAQYARMGTTLVAVVLVSQQLHLIHAGDSRCYQQSGPQTLMALTRDDSVVQEMLDDGTITIDEIDRAPFRHVLSKAVGVESSLVFSQHSQVWQGDQRLLLCSDGLYGVVDENVIAETLNQDGSLQERVDKLIQRSLKNGAKDNVSLIVIENDQSGV